MTRIKVAHVLEAVWSGGVEQRRLILAQDLPSDRYEQILVCTAAKGGLPAQFEAAGVPVHVIGNFRFPLDPRPLARCRRILREFRPHIVHGAVYEGVEAAAIAGRLAGVPIVIGEETSDAHGRRLTGHLLYRALLALTDRMVAVSPIVRDYLVDTIRYPANRTMLIDNGIRDPGPAARKRVRDIRRGCGAGADDILIGTVGRLVDAHKRVSDLLRALASARSTLPTLRLVVVGDGPDAPMLKALADDLGVADIVTFAGYQSETRAFFDAMDIYVHPAAAEAFGLVLVEAMLAGLAIIASRVGGIPAVVDEGITALLVPPGQPTELAQAILSLANDRDLRATLGAAGRQRARARFTAERYAAQIAALYVDTLATTCPKLAASIRAEQR
jgi:glycosyltransferase involved in cell wall biosynthesis